jgi:hypothetical protein
MPLRRLSQVFIAYDVVAVENASGLMAGNLHRHSLRNCCSEDVSYGRSSGVVEKPSFDLSLSTCRIP